MVGYNVTNHAKVKEAGSVLQKTLPHTAKIIWPRRREAAGGRKTTFILISLVVTSQTKKKKKMQM
jgi:hypothetical protein